MKLDYKRELENAAKTMILVHEPDVLIKMIVRMLVQKVKVTHSGVLLHQQDRDSYVLMVSRGTTGVRIPAGFARMDPDNPLIRFFRERKQREISPLDAVTGEQLKKALKRRIPLRFKESIKKVLYQMEIFEAVICVPIYFREELMGLGFLGRKRNRKKFSHAEINFFIALASDVSMAIRNARLFKELEAELR